MNIRLGGIEQFILWLVVIFVLAALRSFSSRNSDMIDTLDEMQYQSIKCSNEIKSLKENSRKQVDWYLNDIYEAWDGLINVDDEVQWISECYEMSHQFSRPDQMEEF